MDERGIYNLLYAIARNTAGVQPAFGDGIYGLAYKIAQNTVGTPPKFGDSMYALYYKIAANTAGTAPKPGDGIYSLLYKIAGNTGTYAPVFGDGMYNLFYKFSKNTEGGGLAGTAAATYYVSAGGNDGNSGTSAGQSWKTLTPVNAHVFLPGETVLFNGGETFTGGISIQNVAGASGSRPITFGSYGTGRATISSAVGTIGCYVYRMGGIVIRDLNFTGPGLATANREGIKIFNDVAATVYPYVRITNCTVTGHVQGIFVKSSVNASGYSDVRITGCDCNTNVRNGILVEGVEFGSLNFSNVYVGYCKAYNNPGLAAQPSHTGSGIQVSSVDGGVIEFCTAYNNGANNTAASGPIGIWFWQANNVVIQFCESYNNQSNGGDGGGFDLDGGVTNSFMQYNYSHGNKGAGFGVYQYATPLPFANNVVRYNISQNDIGGGITLWGQDGSSIVTNTAIYNNTVYNNAGSVFRMINNNVSGITIKNNIFLTGGGQKLVDYGQTNGLTFTKNDYYNLSGAFSINWGGTNYVSLAAWGQDSTGISSNPLLNNAGGGGTIGDPTLLPTLTAYQISIASSPAVGVGVTITNPGTRDFYGDALFTGTPDLGADESSFIYVPPSSTLLTGLVGYWKLDEASGARADSSGSANTLNESAATISGAVGKISNGALLVRSSGKYLTRAPSASLTMGDIDFSIALWVKFNTVGVKQTLIAKGGSPYWEYSIFLEMGGGNDNKLGAYMDGSAGYGLVYWSALATTGTWYFVVVMQDSVADQIRISVNNGSFLNNGWSSPQLATGNVYMGGNAAATEVTDGIIDEVGIWKKCLTAGEITTLYNGGAGVTYPFP